MKIEITSRQQATLSIVLRKEKVNVESIINDFIVCLNGSDSTEDVRWYNELLKGQQTKLKSIDNLLNQLEWK